jgi:hypothetical protein
VKQAQWTPVPLEDRTADGKGWFDIDGAIDLNGSDSGIFELRVGAKDTRLKKSVQRSAIFAVK